MYHLIRTRIEDIWRSFSAGSRADALADYNWLLAELCARDVSSDREYQRRFRAFWRMRCGDKWGRVFFHLLEQHKARGDADPIDVATQLYRQPSRAGKRTLEFSFATKLVHTVNPHQPIYDSMVSRFYFLTPPSDGALKDRLAAYGECFRFLVNEYARVTRKRLLTDAIEKFRRDVPAARRHTDEKIIDWMIWQFVDLAQRERWFARGLCIHR